MLQILFIFLFFSLRLALRLRYRIKVQWGTKPDPAKGILFLANHPALVDPLMNLAFLWPKFRPRVLAVEYSSELGLLRAFYRFNRAVSIPNFETGINEYKIKQAEKTIEEIAEGLKKGDHFLIYPGGQLKGGGKEHLGGSLIAYELLKKCPDASVVLIRTTGLWGSLFSRAFLGKTPPIFETFLKAFKILLKNLLFLTPKRDVSIVYEAKELPKTAPHLEFNRFLENWFNQYADEKGNVTEEEPLKLISYSFYKEEIPQVFHSEKKAFEQEIPKEVREKIYNFIRKILEKKDAEIKPEMHLRYDLGIDSLHMSEIITYVTKNFEIEEIYIEDLETVGSLLAAISGEKRKKTKSYSQEKFPVGAFRKGPLVPEGSTIMECFLNTCERMKRAICCGDDSKIVSYSRMKQEVLILAQFFKTWEEEKVAILLPASYGVYLTIFALLFAKKVPVMLNWTLGPRYLEEMMKLCGAKKIVTSWLFLDRLQNVQFGFCVDQFVFLEQIQKKLSFSAKLSGFFLAKRKASRILQKMDLTAFDENHPCVILFTSGTESLPKGVPLSHKNILSDMRSTLDRIDLTAKDVMYSILPPFHSVGFSAAGLFPLLSGVRSAFYPDPTDSFSLVEGIQRWQVTLFLSTPGLAKGVLQLAKSDELKTIRYFILGSEKTPESLYEQIRNLGTQAELIEGYGITECAPILCLNIPHQPPKGVGKPLKGVELIVIHPETLEKLPQGVDGEICVRGDNVFSGYISQNRSPFIEIDGKSWYRTGDLGHVESDGSLILSGRLKRFIKIAGEMISLGAIEETLIQYLIQTGKASPNQTCLAIVVKEKEEQRPQITLFSTIAITQEEANQILQKAGFSNLIRIALVKIIEEIPLAGTGKLDYRKLEGLT